MRSTRHVTLGPVTLCKRRAIIAFDGGEVGPERGAQRTLTTPAAEQFSEATRRNRVCVSRGRHGARQPRPTVEGSALTPNLL